MPSRTFDITVTHVMRDDDVAHVEGPAAVGRGLYVAGDTAPIGTSAKYRTFMKFSTNWSDMASITSATLHIRLREQANLPKDIHTRSCLSNWSAGGMTWATMPGGGNSSTHSATSALGWKSFDITNIIQAYAPASAGGSGESNYGIMLKMVDENDNGAANYYSIEDAGNEPYITVVYTTNNDPDAPTLTDPEHWDVVNDTTPDFSFTHNDPDGDQISEYRVQVRRSSAPSDWSDLVWDSGWVSTADETPTVTCGVTLTRGLEYFYRARTRDEHGATGPYSGGKRFTVASLPTASVTSPTADVAAPLYYDAGSDTTPKFNPSWSFACAEGGTQTGVSVKIYDEAGTSLLHTYAHSGSTTSAEISDYAPTNGTKYQISVTPTCSHGATGAESSKVRCRVRWGRASYRADLGSAPVSLSTAVASQANSGQVIMEYASSSATTPEPTDWKASVADVAKLRYVWHRVTLLPQPVAAPTSPLLRSVTFTYSANALVPDNWAIASIASIDLGTYVYGTLSLKHTGDGTSKVTTQTIPVVPDTNYIFSGRIKTQGTATATIELYDSAAAEIVATASASNDTDWTRYQTAVWNSGSNNEITVRLRTQGSGIAWFDALKMEASTVVTPWTPGFLGNAVVLDAGGLQVDAQAGGVFRLRGASGGTLDVVALGDDGLVFGDVEVYASASGELTVDGNLVANNVAKRLAYSISASDNLNIGAETTVASLSGVTVAANRLLRITGHLAVNPDAAGQYTVRIKQGTTVIGFNKARVDGGTSADNQGTTIVTIVSSGAGGSINYIMTVEGNSNTVDVDASIAPITLMVEDLGPV